VAELPDKLYYSIREVAEHTGIEPHVLRYWESEFPSLKPKRARSGARNYRRKDVDEILLIRKLLHEEGYRIEGARKHLRELKRKSTAKPDKAAHGSLFEDQDRTRQVADLKQELKQVMDLLKEMKAEGD